jgi:hypothetical protein
LTDKQEIEDRLPRSFFNLHQSIIKILKDNDILPNEEE